jgi:5-methylcytosine-specific restriction protein A
MPTRVLMPCRQPGCKELIPGGGRCDKHKKKEQKFWDDRRGSAAERGYDYEWSKYSKWFLKQPENQFCKLHLPGCAELSEVVDHIKPVDKDDPLFTDRNNHQSACRHCNSVKGRRELKENE